MSEWVVLELTSRGEGEDPDTLRQAITNVLKGVEVFIPAAVSQVGADRVIRYLVEGYAFVRHTLPDQAYMKLEGSKYVQSILTKPSLSESRSRRVSCVPDSQIEKIKGQIIAETEQGIKIGDTVGITSGPYRNMTAKVIEEISELETVQVYVSLRSKQAIVTLPRSFLKLLARGDGDLDPSVRVQQYGEWLKRSRSLISWSPDGIGEVHEKHLEYLELDGSARRLEALEGLLRDPPSLVPVTKKLREVKKLESFVRKDRALGSLVRRLASPKPLRTKLEEVEELQNFVRRIEGMQKALDVAAFVITGNGNEMDNVIIDGHNLAYRIMFGRAGSALQDMEGRPMETFQGFLQSLSVFKKRFGQAHFYVCWDGSDQRRKALFPGYKAGRSEHKLDPNQVRSLQEVLPILGISQVFNPEEESDDLIACLVRGPLKGARNVIVSSDRDFLQLVTPTDVLLTPKVGTRKEVIYDIDKVSEEYGVDPKRMVGLRALLGDTSDKIPGVPRVPVKVLVALLKTHGSIEGIFNSKLPGLTKVQYKYLKSAEEQVKLNLTLMGLHDGLQYTKIEGQFDREAVSAKLVEYGMDPNPILSGFEPPKGFVKT